MSQSPPTEKDIYLITTTKSQEDLPDTMVGSLHIEKYWLENVK